MVPAAQRKQRQVVFDTRPDACPTVRSFDANASIRKGGRATSGAARLKRPSRSFRLSSTVRKMACRRTASAKQGRAVSQRGHHEGGKSSRSSWSFQIERSDTSARTQWPIPETKKRRNWSETPVSLRQKSRGVMFSNRWHESTPLHRVARQGGRVVRVKGGSTGLMASPWTKRRRRRGKQQDCACFWINHTARHWGEGKLCSLLQTRSAIKSFSSTQMAR
jgi:hypothetical protein